MGGFPEIVSFNKGKKVKQEKLITQLNSRMRHLWNRFDIIDAATVDGNTHYRVKSKLREFLNKFGEWVESRPRNSRQKHLPNDAETRIEPPVATAAATTTSITASKIPQIPEYLKMSENDDFKSMSEKYSKLLKFINDFADEYELARPSSFFEQQKSRRESNSQPTMNHLQTMQSYRHQQQK
jgi:hypothetical protein